MVAAGIPSRVSPLPDNVTSAPHGGPEDRDTAGHPPCAAGDEPAEREHAAHLLRSRERRHRPDEVAIRVRAADEPSEERRGSSEVAVEEDSQNGTGRLRDVD